MEQHKLITLLTVSVFAQQQLSTVHCIFLFNVFWCGVVSVVCGQTKCTKEKNMSMLVSIVNGAYSCDILLNRES